jgi:1,4-dihydroxy-2-naphthoate octaprenyltransferase
MPQSKKRKHHHEYRPPANAVKAKKNKSAVIISIIFFMLIGTGIAFFAMGSEVLWLFAGAIAGVICGYFFDRQIDKSFSKK